MRTKISVLLKGWVKTKENKWPIYGHRKSQEDPINKKLEHVVLKELESAWRHHDCQIENYNKDTDFQQNGKLEGQRNPPSKNT